MSVLPLGSLLGSSPQQAPTPGAQGAVAQAGTVNPGGITAVQPPPESGADNSAGSSTSDKGTGAGAGGAASQFPIRSENRFSRPPDAAPISVVNAQVSKQPASRAEPGAAKASSVRVTPQNGNNAADTTAQLPELPQEAQKAQAAAMPNPLPTSPFLKGAENAA